MFELYQQFCSTDLYKKHLLDFLKIWKEEIDSGNPRLEFKMDGICANFANYIHKATEQKVSRIDAFEFLSDEYFHKFPQSITPFNPVLTKPYYLECNHKECHLNTKRIEWVNKTIIELENHYEY